MYKTREENLVLITEISKPGWIAGYRETSSWMDFLSFPTGIQEVFLNSRYKSGAKNPIFSIQRSRVRVEAMMVKP